MSGWIGVDFDGTLAEYGTWVGASHVGKPIPAMVERVKRWRTEGREVRIFTARMYPFAVCLRPQDDVAADQSGGWSDLNRGAYESIQAIRAWCREHLGEVLPITCVKDYGMVELWDDRAVQVRANTGEPVGYSTRGLA
jgi:hypothetical protein